MQLKTGDTSDPLKSPSADQVANAFTRLTGGTDSYVILGKEEQVYVQAAGSVAQGFHVEFRDGSEDRHFQAKTVVSHEVVVDVFQRFLSDDPAWRAQVEWEPWMTGDAGTSSPLPLGLWVAVIGAAALAAVFWYMAA